MVRLGRLRALAADRARTIVALPGASAECEETPTDA